MTGNKEGWQLFVERPGVWVTIHPHGQRKILNIVVSRFGVESTNIYPDSIDTNSTETSRFRLDFDLAAAAAAAAAAVIIKQSAARISPSGSSWPSN